MLCLSLDALKVIFFATPAITSEPIRLKTAGPGSISGGRESTASRMVEATDVGGVSDVKRFLKDDED
jgi:hypothetical protein